MAKPSVKLIGEDGNAFNIIGLCKRAWFSAGESKEEWTKIQDQMMSGDYNNLLVVAQEYFDVE